MSNDHDTESDEEMVRADTPTTARTDAAAAAMPPPLPDTVSDALSDSRPDPRLNAYRPDLAEAALKDDVDAEDYTDGEPGQVTRATVPIRREPNAAQGLVTEAIYGETLTIFDEDKGWLWVKLARDDYVGYLPAECVSRRVIIPTHRVQSLGTFVYPVPDIKTPPRLHLAMNSVVAVSSSDDTFSELATGGFVINRHIAPLDRVARDFVDVAERFIGTPYLWGGRTRIGIDCSGLVQTALQAAGLAAPRDSDMQQRDLGNPIAVTDALDNLRRGDLVFWPGHVGIMTDGVMMVHANAYHMAVSIEPLPEASLRIAKAGSTIAAVRRLDMTAFS